MGKRTRLKYDKITGSFYKEIDNEDYFKLIELIINSKDGVSKNKLAEEIFGKSDNEEVNHYRRIRVSVMIHNIRTRFQIWFITERKWVKSNVFSSVRLATTKSDLKRVKELYERKIKQLHIHKGYVEYDIKNFESYKIRLEKLKEGILMAQGRKE